MKSFEILNKLREVATPEIFKSGWMGDLLNSHGIVLAGGSIRDTIAGVTPKDYDIFFTEEGVYEKVSAVLWHNMTPTAKTAYTETFEDNGIVIQLIFKKVYGSRQEIIKDFDFTPIMFAIDKDGIAVGPNTIADIADKVCRVNVITKPLSSLNRLVRYQELGYDTKEAYDYIISVMQTQPHGIILGGENSFYDHNESEKD